MVVRTMVLVAVMARHRGVRRDNGAGHDGKCDQTKQEIAKRLHGDDLRRLSRPTLLAVGIQPTYRSRRDPK